MAVNSVRFLSSKKPDGKACDENAPSKEPLKEQLGSIQNKDAKLETSDKKPARAKKTKTTTTKYLPMSKLPRPPPEVMQSSAFEETPKRKTTQQFYEFEIPKRYSVVPKPVFSATNSPFEAPPSFFRTTMMDINSRPHPSKESFTGMFLANRGMFDVKDEMLWDMYPNGRFSQKPPFGEDTSFEGFKKWEKEQMEKHQRSLNGATKAEVDEFKSLWYESRSFFRKMAPQQNVDEAKEPKKKNLRKDAKTSESETVKAGEKGYEAGEKEQTSDLKAVSAGPESEKLAAAPKAESANATQKVGGRRKLDRGLLRRFRKYRDSGLLDEDE